MSHHLSVTVLDVKFLVLSTSQLIIIQYSTVSKQHLEALACEMCLINLQTNVLKRKTRGQCMHNSNRYSEFIITSQEDTAKITDTANMFSEIEKDAEDTVSKLQKLHVRISPSLPDMRH